MNIDVCKHHVKYRIAKTWANNCHKLSGIMHKRHRTLRSYAHLSALTIKKRKKVMKRIIAKQEYCMGCGLCEVYCITQHSKSKDIVKAYNREKPRPISRVRLEMSKPVSFAIQCRHCEDAPCAQACLTGAMHKD